MDVVLWHRGGSSIEIGLSVQIFSGVRSTDMRRLRGVGPVDTENAALPISLRGQVRASAASYIWPGAVAKSATARDRIPALQGLDCKRASHIMSMRTCQEPDGTK